MKYFYGFSIICFLYFSTVSCFFPLHKIQKLECCAGKPGNPLKLTPLIKQGKIQEARAAAEVKLNKSYGVESYAGYLTVNDFYDSNLFFWFFPSQTDYKNAPVVLWLQGGPGASSLFGLFAENGPFLLSPAGELLERVNSWTNNHSVIYIDNPVGAGFSYTDEGGYAQNQTVVADELYNALLQFFQVFSELQENNFFVTGESYAGKYIPAISYAIHKNNPLAKQKINLQGLAIGNGLSDPKHQLVYADYLYQIGLIDSNAQAKMKKAKKEIVKHIHKKQWLKAKGILDVHIFQLFKNVTGFSNFYNYLEPSREGFSSKDEIISSYLDRDDVRAELHVDNATFNSMNIEVYMNLEKDFMQSVVPWISELLNHYRILFYNGQLDIIVAYPLTVNFLKHLNFSAAEEYKTAERHQWYVGEELAGYVKQAGNLTEVLVRNAGHMVPGDKPVWAEDLITRFTRNKPLYG